MTIDDGLVLDPSAIDNLRQLAAESENELFIGQLIALFATNAPARLRNIHEAVAARDGATLERAAHTLKSNCSMLGALRMAGYCQDLELMGGRQAFDEAAALLPAATEEFERVARAVAALDPATPPRP